MLEVNNILQSYNVYNTEKLTIIKNLLGIQGLQFIKTLTQAEQELCNAMKGLSGTLSDKFYMKYNEIIKSPNTANSIELVVNRERNVWEG